MTYGKLIPSLGSKKNSQYGFVNEIQIRIGAGLMFTVGFFTFLSVYYAGKYDLALIVVSLFWLDFLLKVISPKYSIVGMVAYQLSKNKEPQRVGAIQKRFARTIGFIMSSAVLTMLIKHNFFMETTHETTYQTITPPMILCLICLSFMWLESILGYCVGCTIFETLVKKNIIQNKDQQNCPDGHCAL